MNRGSGRLLPSPASIPMIPSNLPFQFPVKALELKWKVGGDYGGAAGDGGSLPVRHNALRFQQCSYLLSSSFLGNIDSSVFRTLPTLLTSSHTSQSHKVTASSYIAYVNSKSKICPAVKSMSK